jgi:mono/diheme cytochrome c family protein
VFAVALVALLLIGCGGGNVPQPQANAPAPDTVKPAAVEVSYSKDIQPIFTASCMPCHSGADAKARYDLTAYDKVVTLVVAGKADSSKLFSVLNDGKMPPPGKLDAAKLATIRRWIAQGAKNN